ncbi:MAG: hypothetical protein M0P91_07385 [Sulfuricurvum sp.]|jgi:hypothetical protein|uniref:papain-like cysteine protease family protein n=1 Tax=Sulfuricurvum sp. TaxID=2025608 RepID=UPI0025F82A2C|nr:papain-like cysteine protease family protein [Sulfuricurvum sp.]MCK9373004.1 hypothetical protein [Sulfuricurvum sp.]
MKRYSINGVLKPTDSRTIHDEYQGHFLKVSYIQLISGSSVYSKDRIDVEENGAFRFFLPMQNLITEESITLEVYAPDGSMLGKQIYSYGSLQAALITESAPDVSEPLVIKVDPKVIVFNLSSPTTQSLRKINGKVIDLSGEKKGSGLHVIIMVSDDPNAPFSTATFRPVFSAITDKQGYFYGKIDSLTHQQAYGVIAGLESQPLSIPLEEKKLPKNVLLVTDLSALPEDLAEQCCVPALPDSDELVGSSAFSQDLGGKCIDFTIPNRTLEEFSFYHSVRTTEPEIKGLTITTKESKKIREELFSISDGLFTLFSNLNNSLSTLSLIPYTIDEEKTAAQEEQQVKMYKMSDASSVTAQTTFTAAPVYHLKVALGARELKVNTRDLLGVKRGIDFTDILKILAEQEKRKKKLQTLHAKLASAYCGKYGVEEVKSYCETLTANDTLNRKSLQSLLGHIREYAQFVKDSAKLTRALSTFISELDQMIAQPYADHTVITLVENKCEKLIVAIDKETPESQNQEEFLGYLRRTVSELSQAKEESSHNFEPCPPAEKQQNMGIMCLLKQYDEIKETLRNQSIFSLGEIMSIRSYYDIFLNSITAFLNLLEEFHSFYRSGANFMVSLEDDYFLRHYSTIKDSLISTKRQIYRAITKIEEIERAYITNHPGRRELSVENSIDWDETPTVYENTTIAHGHLLHFKQQWKADGYSLGDLLYSLPLAPCQEKQIAILDWDRNERAGRSENQSVYESLEAEISRDRDISEIINSSFSENINARSTNKTSSTSGGIGGGVGGFISGIAFGIAGGVSHSGASSTSTASQNSARNLSGSSLNRLQDNVSQSASSLRGQRSTVIQTVGQNENLSVQTEVIKNNNHCHAMTVEYFEVLRHYAIEQNLADVQECLFVPLPMSHFDHAKVLRWSNTLRRGIYGTKLRRGFDAIERIETNYANSDFPVGSYCDETIEEFSGNFTITFDFKRPYIKSVEEATKTEEYDLSIPFPWFIGKMVFHLEQEVPLSEAEKDAIFEEQYAPAIVRSFIETLQIDAIADNGAEVRLDLDYTILSTYRKRAPLQVSIASKSLQNITRRQIKHLRFRANTIVTAASKIILRSGYLHYRTVHMSEYILRNAHINNDIINSVEIHGGFTIVYTTDAALLYTPMNTNEQRNPRKEDREAAAALIAFLNEHMEMSHKLIWGSMDGSRLFGLLDGYIAPNSGGRSVASVVENKIMGIVGNNLILKVVPGERLDPVFRGVEDLMGFYQPTAKPDPFRISVPTKGVYAESVMGRCNSCEEIDDSRHWRFEDAPCGTKPTAIGTVSTDSRRSDPGNLQVKDFPTSIITMQNAPSAPDPTGLAAAYSLLGKSDAFKDMTGLAGTQSNAIKALETTSKSVTDLANIAADIQKQQGMKKDIGKTLKTIQQAETEQQISKDQANKLSYSALSSLVGEPTNKAASLTEQPEVKELIKAQGAKSQSNIMLQDGAGASIQIKETATTGSGSSFDYTVPGLVPIIAQPSNMTCWATVATMMLSWHDNATYTIQTAMDTAGAKYRTMFDNNVGLPGAEHDAFASACGLTAEPPMSYTISGLRSLIENHGPLIAVADEAPGALWAIHARVIRGIYGDGTVDGTFLRINDPAGGRQYTESFRAFAKKFEEVAYAPRLQIMHY